MAVYNGGKYLRTQVESILSQSVRDFELIMVDDCSTDGSWELMNTLAREDSRIHVCRNNHNLGFKDNFQMAMTLCHGSYIALSDCDDIWMPDHLQQLLDAIGDKAMACGDSEFIDADGNSLGTTLSHQESLDWIPDDDMGKIRSIILFRNAFQGATMLMRRGFADTALPIPKEMRFHDTWLASLACFCGGISYVRQPLMKYRRLETSITGMRGKRKSKLYRFLRTRFDDDRADILSCIEQRIGDRLSPRQRKVIGELRHVLSLYGSGHVSPGIYLYELRHYREIYSCDFTHLI